MEYIDREALTALFEQNDIEGIAALGNEVIPLLIDALSSNMKRETAVTVLGKMGDRSVVSSLLRVIDDLREEEKTQPPPGGHRKRPSETNEEERDESLRSARRWMKRGSERFGTRKAVLQAISRLGPYDNPEEILLKVLPDCGPSIQPSFVEEIYEGRLTVAGELIRALGPEVISVLEEIARTAGDPTGSNAAVALCVFGEAAAPSLAALGRSENSRLAVRGIDAVREMGAMTTSLEEMLVENANRTEDNDAYLRRQAVQQLGKVDSASSKKTLIDRLENDRIPAVRKAAIASLTWLTGTACSAALADALHEQIPDLRKDAADVLEKRIAELENDDELATLELKLRSVDRELELNYDPFGLHGLKEDTRKDVAGLLEKIDARRGELKG